MSRTINDLHWAILENPFDDASKAAYIDAVLENAANSGDQEEIKQAESILREWNNRHKDIPMIHRCYPAGALDLHYSGGFITQVRGWLKMIVYEELQKLFERFPIVDVKVTDRQPESAAVYGFPSEYIWYCGGSGKHYLPRDVFDDLTMGDLECQKDHGRDIPFCRVYTSRHIATRDLSQAIIAKGRLKAGLRPIDWGEYPASNTI